MLNNGPYLKTLYKQATALGDKSVVSDAWFEVKGYEGLSMLIKQFPMPELSSAGEIEVPGPLGMANWQPQQIKVNQQGQMTFMETRKGAIRDFLEQLVAQGGTFDAVVYEGTPDEFSQKWELTNCFLQIDPTDRDWENRATVTMISGTLFYHYFGKTE